MTTQAPQLKCLRCEYQWTPRKEGRPKQCPNCKQNRWNVPSKYGRTPEAAKEKA